MHTINHYINGGHTSPSQRTQAIFEPATGEQRATVSLASAADVVDAIEIAKKAHESWSKVTPLNRARVLFKFKALVEANMDQMAELITREHGKVLDDAKGEIIRGLEVVEFACGIPHLLKGEHTEQVGGGVDAWTLNQSLGVVAGIAPFNFPVMVPMWMFPIAIACGNSFIMKPSEKDPSSVMRMAELLTEAGLPDGVFNVVNGDKEAVDTLLTHKDVHAISFVGSTPIAEYIYATASAHGKRVQALGGAKNHMVLMPDADLDQAVGSLMGAAYGSAGERCMAISVVLAVGDSGDALVEKLLPQIKSLKVGNGVTPEMDMGPLISAQHLEKVTNYIETGVNEGAKLLADGRQLTVTDHEQGYFLGGCLFDHVTPEMTIYKEEIFGPVLAIVRVKDYAEALQLINDHEFGNGTAIFTQSGEAARHFCHHVQVGMVGVNVPIPVPMAFHSFGGWKRSLFGPLHMHGPDGVRFYTKRKAITARWPQPSKQSKAEFVMPTMK
ncbi:MULTISPECIES: CoA-acylating methylmalonate-semialdehyde dehydrogenase [unclassified Shewanella]|jgi:malonate-semialdehyde dehydrogenase (acetylating)/methylmalonate-semialdehyde dehydrogenase|uniref:CoA-acylating methylmalonate-semialdehyde dehydrogenase n=1 Tax=unclassified Shewanella TaxID=196818 RepID=UPI000C7A42B4|nr:MULTISPECIES: CoA-acylating methylmalonate-semialdehyde dehydrogenase [unclassified Shewanella]PKG55377.1 methylmalonate-semialdehyde dehydrogenase (CoA acylating) [Shewanella sp. GutDb-MelDb]PKG76130.1 methylmalonate-semialdehyde dehydrogenase (CoA acylating) [Shewanella sp. GutCb]